MFSVVHENFYVISSVHASFLISIVFMFVYRDNILILQVDHDFQLLHLFLRQGLALWVT